MKCVFVDFILNIGNVGPEQGYRFSCPNNCPLSVVSIPLFSYKNLKMYREYFCLELYVSCIQNKIDQNHFLDF